VADPNQERVWFAREVMGLFVKAFTQLKLYPHDHAYVVEALEKFGTRLRAFVKLHSVLRFKVSQDNLTVEDQPVYESENPNENLAFRLYVDGLREIAIAQGVTQEEAAKLAHVFYQAIVDQDSDSTLLMWEADFRNIDHVAINSLTDAWESPDYFNQDQLDLLKQMNRDVDSIVESLTANAGRGTYSFELTDGGSELERADDLDDDTGEREDGDDIFDVDSGAIADFANSAKIWGPDRLLRVLNVECLDGLALMPDVMPMGLVQWLTTESVSMSLRSRDMDLLSDLLGQYANELDATEERDPTYQVFKGPFNFLGREENIERLIRMAQGGGLGGPKAFTRILHQMGEPGMLTAASTYRVSETQELRDALTDYMKDHVKLNPQALQLLCREDVDAETVRTALFVANNRISPRDLGELLEVARRHPDAEIQKYAEHLWRTNTDQGRVKIAIDALTSDVRADRVKSLKILVRGKHVEAVENLKAVISGAEFLHKDAHERKAFFDALRFLGGMRAVGFLEEQTKRGALIFNRRAAKETRQFASQALKDLKNATAGR